MKPIFVLKRCLLTAAIFVAPQCLAIAEPQVLATIDGLRVTSDELASALASSSFSSRFPSMDEDDQAALRGDMLQHLVASRQLTLEAGRLGLDKDPQYLDALEAFRLGLLYRQYMDKLRERIRLPADLLAALKQRFKGDPDGLAASKSAYIADHYRRLHDLTLQQSRDSYHIRLDEERIKPGATADATLLLEGDGIRITYGDLVRHAQQTATNAEWTPEWIPEWIKDQLYRRAVLLTIAKAAADEGVDASKRIAGFPAEGLPALLVERKQAEWTADETALRAFFAANPQLGRIEERSHFDQLAAASRAQAETLGHRILAGESLFALAEEHSIDPYGRSHRGDMGWQKAGSAHPAIERAIGGLADGEVSAVVETPLGYHLVTILERRPGGQKATRVSATGCARC